MDGKEVVGVIEETNETCEGGGIAVNQNCIGNPDLSSNIRKEVRESGRDKEERNREEKSKEERVNRKEGRGDLPCN